MAQACSTVLMHKTLENPLVRARVDPRRKRAAEKILGKMGISPGQAINMLYAQIELKHGLPFPVLAENNSDVLPPIEQVAATWAKLDKTDYSYLAQ
jgi:addiction module RelB/DinJ family antitoxin